LINKVDCPEGTLLISEDPFSDFNRLTNHFKPFESAVTSISTSAIVGQGLLFSLMYLLEIKWWRKLFDSPNVAIYDNTIIGNNVVIHAEQFLALMPFITKARCWLRQIAFRRESSDKDNVDIGALYNDRGSYRRHNYSEGTKIDNQVHVGHDTIIGKNV
jgi:UDP-3-O-[3-hydroxymyristoyl] glucosamine N-acyltransferase